ADVEMIEAHGTGTRVGDRVEFTALNQVFSQKTRRPAGEAGEEEETRERWCALGSVKSMIGHTKAAAGAAGMIKAILALRNKVLPPTIKVDAPDPGLDVETSPFYLNTETRPWFTEKNRPRRCGISAFGFGGSNFHAVLEEYESAKSEIAWDGSVDIVALSSSSKDGLSRAARALANVADQDPSENELAEKTARTRGEFRASHAHRLLLVLDRTEERPASLSQLLSESLEILDAPDSGNRPVNPRTRENIHYTGQGAPGKIAFMFPGQGSQRPGMGRDLVCEFPAAFAMLETANRIAASESGGPGRLSDLIFPHPVFTGEERTLQKRTLSQTENAQPSIGAISAGMLAILNQFGVKPDVTCGHSFGELTALMAADWIDAETLMRLAVFRGRLMAMAGNRTDLGRGEDASGAMLAVIAPLADIEALLPDLGSEVILANRNGPNQGVLSGPAPAIERAATLCGQRGHRTLTLPVSAAFHGPMMADAHAPFAENLKKIRIAPTDIPVFSNTTAGPYPRDPDAVRALLAGHLLHPVNFIGEIEKLHESGIRTFVEVGPGSTLTRLVSSILKDRPFTSVSMDASVGKRSGKVDLARTLCRLAAEGAPVDLNQWDPPAVRERPGRMSIPILGANISPRPTRAPKRTVEKTERPVRKKPSPGSARNPGPAGNPEPIAPAEAPGRIRGARRAPAPSNPGDNPMHGKVNTMPNTEKDAPRQPGLIPDALKMVQEGLKSMQALQAQTAETHQKFLETQTEASRTLQEMIRNTSRLAEASMGVPVTTAAPAPAVHPAPPAEPAVVPAVSTGAARAITAPAPPSPGLDPAPPVEQGSVAVDPAPTPPAPAITVQPETSDGASPDRRKEIEKLLLSVVSDLTGYPEEMLGIDMDIEADLGIDSIKRVEILSTLEERMPNLPAVSPEIMGSMRTLGQIAGHLASDAAGQPDAADAAGIQERTLTRTPENRADAETAPSPRDAAVIEDALLTVVSDLTGYPREMIGLDMDIEADLGIDSIKRVEILSTLEEKLTDLPPVSPDAMGSLRTLAQIAAHLSQAGAGSEAGDEAYEMMDVAESAPTPSPEPAPPARETLEGPPDEVERYIASRREHPFVKGEPLTLPEGVKVFVTDDRTGLSEAITDALGESDINTVLISPDILKYKKTFPRAAGLIIVQGGDPDESSQALKNAFTLARHFGPDLMESAKNGGAVFATVTRVDGAFGFNDRGVEHPMSGGLPGLVKTAAREWPGVRCRAIDLSPGWTDNQAAAEAFKAEILTGDPDGPVEVGLDADARIILALEPSPLPTDLTPEAGFDVIPDDVIVLTGGARGVTASAAMALAQRARPTLALIGRSPAPEPEPDWLRPLTEPSAVKIAILENEFNGSAPTPVQLEKTFKARMANREIAETLHRLRQTGAEVSYFSADVRDPDAITPVFKAIRSAHGAVT
ncbi:MAG: acyltransferase domain-containing protein, partial [Desulfobacterales bacterium]|nr:acyltransferase domain-containing protein [Desulfobacterales bacterium]